MLIQSLENSAADDKSLLNGWVRDIKVSEEQRLMTRELLKEIDNFKPEKNDEKSLDGLKKLISKTDSEVEHYRSGNKMQRGHLNQTLSNISAQLDRFYNKLTSIVEINLVNVEDNQNPFNILCAHSIHYFGKHILCPPDNGLIFKTFNLVTNLISDSSTIEIKAQKEACLILHLSECKKKIDGLDKTGRDYKQLSTTFVIDTIHSILRKNAEICEKSKPINTIPVQLTAFAVARIKTPGMKPSRGQLKVAMEDTLKEIENVTEIQCTLKM